MIGDDSTVSSKPISACPIGPLAYAALAAALILGAVAWAPDWPKTWGCMHSAFVISCSAPYLLLEVFIRRSQERGLSRDRVLAAYTVYCFGIAVIAGLVR